ncbi:MAG: DUF465 domain-containing protein [Neomegalonema sp.]|nr:DUF465 domain-containing protein [Neomegalonema sp.]
MSHTPNELTEFFPADKIAQAKAANPHVAKIADQYHELNRQIHRGETDVEPMSDEHMEELRKQRLALLDEIKSLLA